MAGQGYLSKLAVGKETTWGTGVSVNEVVPFTNESLNKAIEKLMNEYLDRTAGVKTAQNGNVSVTGDLTAELVYDEITGAIIGVESLIYAAFGAASRVEYPATSGNFYNKYTLADDISVSYTAAINKGVSVWEMQGGKVNTLEISATAGGKGQISVGLIGKNLLRTGDSGIVNTVTTINNLAPTVEPTIMTLDQLTVRLDTIASGALTSADEQAISEFTFSLNNNLSDPTFASGSTLTLEPIRNGFREVTLKLTFPRYEADTLIGYYNDNTELQADLKFASGTKQFNILLPRLVISEVPEAAVGGAEIVPLTVTFKALYNGNENSVMTFTDTTTITGEAAIEVKGSRTALP